ncbi:MAG: hypothetical protein OEM41_06135 [Ignavibacteria bacterium]|nr:hypothetical protein [Ignavibacteria bacterium]
MARSMDGVLSLYLGTKIAIFSPMKESVRVLMAGLIDYAGLFPPAGLPMNQAVSNFERYRAGSEAWALGRFIVPASRLKEFEDAISSARDEAQKSAPLMLSALLTSGDVSEINLLLDFNRRHAERTARIETVEVKATTTDEVRRIGRSAGGRFTVYCEFPIGDGLSDLISSAAEAGLRAKVRTGGVTPEVFPPTTDLVRFLYACSTKRLPFKATAGLHHAVRGSYRLTYERNSPSGTMSGFLNVFVAAALLVEGMDINDAVRVLEETDAGAFQFDESGVVWRSYRLPLDRLSLSRRGFAIAFGSCSFLEPIEEMRALNLL